LKSDPKRVGGKLSYSQVIHRLPVVIPDRRIRIKIRLTPLKKKDAFGGRKIFHREGYFLDRFVGAEFMGLCGRWGIFESLERGVLGVGLEPTFLAEPDPKSGASANFATRADGYSSFKASHGPRKNKVFKRPRAI
jgi:hypothetical protein